MTFKSISLISLSVLTLGLLSGCGASSTPQPANTQTTIYQPSGNSTHDFGYLYNRNNNLEYMDTKSIEKLKKAVAILIDKFDAMERKNNTTNEVKNEVVKMTGQLHSQISELKQQVEIIGQSKSTLPPEISSSAKEQYTEDDMKILQFIEGKNR